MAERTLFLWNNDYIVRLITSSRKAGYKESWGAARICWIYIYPADSSSPPALFIARLATGGDQTDDVVVVPEEQRSFRHLPGGGCLRIRWSDDPKQKPTMVRHHELCESLLDDSSNIR